MAASYGFNFLTVRRALKELVNDGTVIRRIGSGTFVAKHAVETNGVRRTTNRLGVLVYRDCNAHTCRLLQSIDHAGRDQKVELQTIWVSDFDGDVLSQAMLLKKQGCVAITLPWFPHDRTDDVRAFVCNSPLPVSLPIIIPGLERNSFETKDMFGGSLQTTAEALCDYFQMMGHRRIAFLGPDLTGDVILQQALSAYSRHTSRQNLPALCSLVRSGAQVMDQLADRWKAFRGDLAVISYDDEHALRFMTAMHKIGLSAPADFKIVGYNDTEASEYSDPPLSSIRQNFDYIGHWLIKSALALADGGIAQSTQMPRPKMVVRATCGGLERIDEAFFGKLSNLDMVVESGSSDSAAKARWTGNGA